MSHRRAIGLVTTFISGRFFEQFMNGLQTVAWQHQVDVLVIQGTPEQVALTQIGQQRVDGWLVLTYLQGLDLLAQQGKPIVTISGRLPEQRFPSVLPDNRQGMENTVEHLIARGHTRIAFVGDTSIGDIDERYRYYQSTLARHGIAVDPELVVITDNPRADRGVAAAHKLLAAKVSCTAVIGGNDWTAIGLMREFQANGYNIPNDIAFVGFDDIPEAQVTNPPLSTVRQRTDELGSIAAKLLLAQIAGETVAPVNHYVPTVFVPRESSGTNMIERMPQRPEPIKGSETLPWQTALAHELVRVLLPAVSPDPHPSPAQVWPEVDKLVRLIAETVEGKPTQTLDANFLHNIFSSPPILNANPEILVEMLRVLDTAGMALVADGPNASQARQPLRALLDQLLVEVMRSYRRRQNNSQRTLSEVLQSQFYISQLLLESPPQQLEWLKETSMYTGCLGLWTPSGGNHSPAISIAGSYQRDGTSALRPGQSYTAGQFPPIDLLPSTPHQKDITTCVVMMVRTADHDLGMLVVSGPLLSNDPWLEDNTVNTLEISGGFLGLTLEREALQESLHHSSEYEERLTAQIRDLSCPVIPVMDRVVLLPLAGVVDMEQASQVITNALGNDLTRHASDILLDLTGVQFIDNRVVRMLIDITQTIILLGSRVTLIGISADIQQRILGTGMTPGGVTSQPNLATAIDRLKRARQGIDPGQHQAVAV
jgi:DNA-binding LacI/PurR family transcriptional regulator/anti-anti-sigma regulatory factor